MEPVEMFERASADAATMVGCVQPDRWHASTPCSEWDVEALVSHMMGGCNSLEGAIGDEPSSNALDEGSYRAAMQRCVVQLRSPGVLERRCQSPAGFEWSVGEAVAGTAMDQVVHTWDLAVALGVEPRLDAEVVEACVAMFLPHMPAAGREAGFVGPEVLVPEGAPVQAVLLGAMGREP